MYVGVVFNAISQFGLVASIKLLPGIQYYSYATMSPYHPARPLPLVIRGETWTMHQRQCRPYLRVVVHEKDQAIISMHQTHLPPLVLTTIQTNKSGTHFFVLGRLTLLLLGAVPHQYRRLSTSSSRWLLLVTYRFRLVVTGLLLVNSK